MLKILHINSTIGANSGVMSVLMNYYYYLDKTRIGFDFLYYLPIQKGGISYQSQIEMSGGKIYFIPNFNNIVEFNRKLDKLLKENQNYEIVHIHDPFVSRFIFATLRKNGIKHIVVHSHATKWSDKKLNGIRNYIVCRNLNAFLDHEFACSKAAGDFLFGRNAQYFVMNNAIDVEKYKFNERIRKTLRDKYGVKDSLVFGHVGNFNNQKNHKFLISIYKEIVKFRPQSRLVLIGDGVRREEVETLVRQERLEINVMFLGKRSDVEQWYQMMDCFILPSLYEGLPMVGVEAQCSGLPILMSNTITQEVGLYKFQFLSLDDTPGLWAKKAVELAENVNGNRLDAQSIITAKGFNICKQVKELEKMYFSMVKK